MQFNFETENKENSQVLLKVTVDKEEVRKNYNDILAETSKDAIIDGFRKGKVPVSILELKYKQGFLAETANKLIDESYKEIIEKLEKKPLTYGTPKLEEFKLPELDSDFIYELLYDVYPDFKIGEYKGIEVTKNEIKISDEEVEKEIAKLVRDFATIESKDGEIDKSDIAMVEYAVFLDGKEVFKKESEYIHLEKNYDHYKIGENILGMKKDEEKEFTKTYSDTEIESLKGKTFSFKVKIKDIKKEVIPELNDDLSKQINPDCNTVDELKKTIEKNLSESSENYLKQTAVNKILDVLIASFEGEIPQSMIDQQIDAYYNDLVQRYRGDEKKVLSMLAKENVTKESYREKMKDQAIKEIKKALILNNVIKNENIKATEEDVKAHLEPFAKYYQKKVDELFDTFKNAGNLSTFENEVEIKKSVDFLFDNAKVKKGKKLTYEELIKGEEEEKTDL